jgi:hypothetical protein
VDEAQSQPRFGARGCTSVLWRTACAVPGLRRWVKSHVDPLARQVDPRRLRLGSPGGSRDGREASSNPEPATSRNRVMRGSR